MREVLPAVIEGLDAGREVVLAAPPGAGKTTLVPLALLGASWRREGRILMLEPRRLAARAAADRMASLLGEEVGETVGYRIRMEKRVGPATRIEVITEGILTRMVQADPELRGVACLIFDEFHERNLHADLSLALVQDARQALRQDLRLAIMSATLDVDAVAAALPKPCIVRSEGRMFPVSTHYVDASIPGASSRELAEMAASAVRRALAETEGSILVFLPGQAEIRHAFELLGGTSARGTTLHMLFGSLPFDAQKAALEPACAGQRKVVLSTDLAESSLTVDGVTVVVDTGVRRLPIFDAHTGLTRLATRPISEASANQRRGRAGRTAPGVCYRLWSSLEDAHRRPFDPPEILSADLAPLVLELAAWGARDVATLRWVTPPPPDAVATSRALLTQLGALGLDGRVTPLGRAMTQLGMHPRLARMLLTAAAHSSRAAAAAAAAAARGPDLLILQEACAIAALLEEGDILRGDSSAGADLRLRLDLMGHSNHDSGSAHRAPPDRKHGGRRAPHGALARVRRLQKEFERKARSLIQKSAKQGTSAQTHLSAEEASLPHFSAKGTPPAKKVPPAGGADFHVGDVGHVGELVALAWPDRLAQRIAGREGHFRLRNGSVARLRETDPLARHAFLAVAETGGRGAVPWIFLAAPISQDAIERLFAGDIRAIVSATFNADTKRVEVAEGRVLDALVLSSGPARTADPEEVARILTEAIGEAGLHVLPWNLDTEQLRDRIHFLRERDQERDHDREQESWPEHTAQTVTEWLQPHVCGMQSFSDLRKLDLKEALLTGLSWEQRKELDHRAPDRIRVPSGSQIRIDYSGAKAPVLSVRLQEVFGLTETPKIDNGRVPLVMHLLSPAHRPVQVTTDLEGFWRTSYYDVRKDMRGRYPKHIWPENPLEAAPTSRTTRRPGK